MNDGDRFAGSLGLAVVGRAMPYTTGFQGPQSQLQQILQQSQTNPIGR